MSAGPRFVQFKVQLPAEVVAKLSTQAEALGFLSGNAVAAVVLAQIADIPEHRFWESLAQLRRSRAVNTHRKGPRA